MTGNRSKEILNTHRFYFSARLTADLGLLLKTPLTIVEAPMGFGKTTAVCEFLDNNGIRRLWVPVPTSPSWVSENAFWRDFCNALASCPEAADVADSLARLGLPRDSVRFEAARELFRQLRLREPAVLVVDDFHRLPSPDFGVLCEVMAQELQNGTGFANLHIALVTRYDYPGKIERLRQNGACGVIDTESFRFTIEDIQDYCVLRELDIDREQIRILHKRTGGWISCLNLHLNHFSAHDAFLPPACGSAPQKDKSTVFSEVLLPPESARMLEEESYAPLSQEIKDLLFALCPLQRFTVHQADFLYGSDTREFLAELVRQNSFIRFDAKNSVYSMPDIFRDLPVLLFKDLPLERRRAIHRRCGDWFAQEGEFLAAMKQYYEIRDFEKALAVMEQDMARNLVTENAAFFAQMFKTCPEDILARHPGAAFKHALAALAASESKDFRNRCDRLEEQCAAMPENDPQTRIWRGELEMLLALTKYNDIAAMSAHHIRGYELMGRPTGLYPPESTWTMGCPSVLFMFHRESGKLQENVRLLHTTLPRYYLAAAYHGAGGEYLFEAESLYHAGEFSRAEVVCREAQAMSERHKQTCNLICALFLRLRLALARGEGREALELAATGRALISRSREYYLLYTADMCEGWLYSLLGEYARIPGWLREGASKESRIYSFAKGWQPLVLGRVLLRAGEYAAAIGEFKILLGDEVCLKHRLLLLYAHIYLAAAHYGLGDKSNAARALREALEEALPDNMYMPFVENNEYILPILRSLIRGRHRQGIQRILELTKDWNMRIQAAKEALSVSDAHPLAALTEREREMVRLRVDGKSLKTIAAERDRTLSAIKKIFSKIYAKLDAPGWKAVATLLTRRA
jgi:LuxR family maltose regulon positive regulatory protein